MEALALDFGLRRFQHYLIGGPKNVILTDHQLLESLWKSNRKVFIRLERIQLRHQHINNEVKWQRGKDNPADYLSRHAIPLTQLPYRIAEETQMYAKLVFMLHNNPYTTAFTTESLYNAQQADIHLRKLAHLICAGISPTNDPYLKPYNKVLTELTLSDGGLIMKGQQIILPLKLYHHAIQLAHQGRHPGQSQVLQRIKSHFWFPKMEKAIAMEIQSYHQCQIHTQPLQQAPLTPAPLPSQPWENVLMDLFGPLLDKSHILVTRCNLSRFTDAKLVKSTSAKPVLPALAKTYK